MRTLTLNIIKGYGLDPVLNVSQFDKGYTVTATVQKGAESFTPPAGSTATVEGRKPDGTGYQYPATIDGSTVTFTVMQQMTVLSGRSMAEIVFYDADSVRIGTANFYLLVEEAPLNESTVISETDLPTIQQALDLLKNGALAPGIIGTASGDVAAFSDGARDTALSSLAVNIAPVQSGSGDPSPSNIRPISGWQTVNVTRAGKNILPSIDDAVTMRGVTYTPNDDGSITISGTASGGQSYINVAVIPLKAGEYIFSTGATVTGFVLENGSYHNLSNGSIQFTTGGADSATVRITVANGTTINTTVYPMLRLASIADATYEPYKGETFPVTLPTEAGTVYGGVVDPIKGKLTLTSYHITPTSANILPFSDITEVFGIATPNRPTDTAFTAQPVGLYCNVLPALTRSVVRNNKTQGICYDTGVSRLQFCLSGVTTLAAAREWVQTNAVEVVYKLATPIEYDLTPTQIKTLYGYNTIYADCGSIESVEYTADTKMYIDAKIAELQALVLENA